MGDNSSLHELYKPGMTCIRDNSSLNELYKAGVESKGGIHLLNELYYSPNIIKQNYT